MVAGWWLLIFGIATPIVVLILVAAFPGSDEQEWQQASVAVIVVSIIIGFFYMLPGIFLLQVKRWAWTAAVIILSIELFYFLYSLSEYGFYSAIPLLFLLIPLILVITDRKNYLRWCDYWIDQG